MKTSSMRYRLSAYDAKIQTLLDDQVEGIISEEDLFKAFSDEIHPLIGKRMTDFDLKDAEIWIEYHKRKAEEQIAHTKTLFGISIDLLDNTQLQKH